jgi:hypothetical protein
MSWNIVDPGRCVVKTVLGFRGPKRWLRLACKYQKLKDYIHKAVLYDDNPLGSLSC